MHSSVSPPGWVVNAPVPGKRKTFCVLGVARGGTSMVSGLLTQLGIPMGETIDEANREDLEFTAHRGNRRLFWGEELRDERVRYIEHLRRQIGLRNERHGCWGWKDPIAIYYLPDIENDLINPHYVLITRDAGAIATAEMLAFQESEPRVLLNYFRSAVGEYERCVEFLMNGNRPTLVISYERAVRYPIDTVQLCARFALGDTARLPQDEFDKLVAYIRPERGTAGIAAHLDDDINSMAATEPAAAGSMSPLFRHFATYQAWMEAVAARITRCDEVEEAGTELAAEPEADEWHRRLTGIYGAAAAALNQGDHQTAGTMACRCLNELAGQYPMAVLGPTAVAGAVEAGITAAHELPELLVGVYNIVGLFTLLNGEAGFAHDHFEAGHLLARRRLETLEPAALPISMDLVWWLAFHAALAAKTANRPVAWRRNIDAIRGYLNSVNGQGAALFNLSSAQDMYERARHEWLI